MSVQQHEEDGTTDGRLTSAAHQALRREVNEQISEINERFLIGAGETIDVMCECAHGDCTGRITIQVAAYEQVRRFATRFLVKQGHEIGDAERVVGEGEGYVVVQRVAVAPRGRVTAPVT